MSSSEQSKTKRTTQGKGDGSLTECPPKMRGEKLRECKRGRLSSDASDVKTRRRRKNNEISFPIPRHSLAFSSLLFLTFKYPKHFIQNRKLLVGHTFLRDLFITQEWAREASSSHNGVKAHAMEGQLLNPRRAEVRKASFVQLLFFLSIFSFSSSFILSNSCLAGVGDERIESIGGGEAGKDTGVWMPTKGEEIFI